jgi:hypothetical protein
MFKPYPFGRATVQAAVAVQCSAVGFVAGVNDSLSRIERMPIVSVEFSFC